MNDVNVQSAARPTGFFDEQGRRIPSGLKSAVHAKSRHYFQITKPAVDYGVIHQRLSKHLPGIGIARDDFETRAEAILQRLKEAPATRNLCAGVAVPFMLPRATYMDYGEALESIYLKGVRAAFTEAYPQHQFVNHHKSGLAGKLSIAPGSRHESLIQAMKDAPQVGYFFPCLTEYSIPAALEQLQALPEKFLLAGGFEISAALIGVPNLLVRLDGYPPLLWLSALIAEKEHVGYHFEAYGYNQTFNRRTHLDQAAEYWASGLVVLG